MDEFKTKSAEELEAMSAVELQAYYTEKLTHEKDQLEARIKQLEEEKEGEKYDSLEAEIKELKNNEFKTLMEAVKTQGVVLEKVRTGSLSGSSVRDIEGTIEKALQDNADNFKAHAAGESDSKFKFDVKVAGDMTIAGNVSGGDMPQAQRLEGVNEIAERIAKTYPMIPKLNTDRNTIEWVYEANQDGTIDGTAEGAAKDQIDNDFVITSVSLVKRAAHFKVSTEMLDDVTFMAGWLRNKLIVRLFLDVDNQCLNGSGAANQVNGILNQATAFAAGTFANTVDNANDVDSLVVAVNQIEIANQAVTNLQIKMHPSDVAALKLIKLSTTDKRYVDRLVIVAGELSLDGVPIVKDNNITVGDFLVGDFDKATIVQKSGISVEVGLDGNDFTNNMRTILAEWRGQLFVQNNDTTAFVTGTFATTNAALETP
jgi:HK97 family phage major capsid protein